MRSEAGSFIRFSFVQGMQRWQSCSGVESLGLSVVLQRAWSARCWTRGTEAMDRPGMKQFLPTIGYHQHTLLAICHLPLHRVSVGRVNFMYFEISKTDLVTFHRRCLLFTGTHSLLLILVREKNIDKMNLVVEKNMNNKLGSATTLQIHRAEMKQTLLKEKLHSFGESKLFKNIKLKDLLICILCLNKISINMLLLL